MALKYTLAAIVGSGIGYGYHLFMNACGST